MTQILPNEIYDVGIVFIVLFSTDIYRLLCLHLLHIGNNTFPLLFQVKVL